MFDKLFREREAKLQQRQILENEYFSQFTYTPSISDKSKPSLDNFYKRLQDWVIKKTEKEREYQLDNLGTKKKPNMMIKLVNYCSIQ